MTYSILIEQLSGKEVNEKRLRWYGQIIRKLLIWPRILWIVESVFKSKVW